VEGIDTIPSDENYKNLKLHFSGGRGVGDDPVFLRRGINVLEEPAVSLFSAEGRWTQFLATGCYPSLRPDGLHPGKPSCLKPSP
jgi:hypothetical protein